MVDTGGQTLRLLSCALRNTGSGWGLINDKGHEPTGVTGVVQHPDHLELTHAVGAVKVSSMQVTPDEYFAAYGVRCGVSGGLALSRIYLYTGSAITPVDPATVVGTSGNLWFTGYVQTKGA
ncbi:hypothetical protein [Streptomyces rubiginosohelvolus]|uniref:hypothetical protein n=1 Tax=Streptomyces rubiginosohelvolus TaxID=67362 RepID=UPI0036CF9CFB